MIYDLSKDTQLKSFLVKSEYLIEKGFIVELSKKQKARSVNQNSYLHVLFSLYGIEVGLTIEEVKIDIKRACPFGFYKKNGVKYPIQTSKMDTKELTEFIEWFRNFSAQQGYYLPSAEEYKIHKHMIDQEIYKIKPYL